MLALQASRSARVVLLLFIACLMVTAAVVSECVGAASRDALLGTGTRVGLHKVIICGGVSWKKGDCCKASSRVVDELGSGGCSAEGVISHSFLALLVDHMGRQVREEVHKISFCHVVIRGRTLERVMHKGHIPFLPLHVLKMTLQVSHRRHALHRVTLISLQRITPRTLLLLIQQ